MLFRIFFPAFYLLPYLLPDSLSPSGGPERGGTNWLQNFASREKKSHNWIAP